METEIKEEFNRSGFAVEEGGILNKCLTFCINFKLSPSALVSDWEVYYLNRQLTDQVVRDEEMEGFLLHLQNEQKEALIKEEPYLHIYSSKDIDMLLDDEPEDVREGLLETPTGKPSTHHKSLYNSGYKSKGSVSSSGRPSSSLVTPFGQRVNKFVVQFAINKQEATNGTGENHETSSLVEDDIIRKVQPREKCSLNVHGCRPEHGYRFMYDRIENKFNALEERINKNASAFVASGLHENPVDPTVSSQKTMFAVGMISCDGEGGRLNEKSVLLQSSVEHSGGQWVRLDLEKLSHYSIFPGQVVGIVGNNPSGHCLIASDIIDSVPFSESADENLQNSKRKALNEESLSNDLSDKASEISLVIASGPFTTTDNLLFEPLSELLAYATRKQPQLLVLLGPFVDSEHPEVKKATLDRSFDDIFHQEIIGRLRDYVEYMGSGARVLLVPSVRDSNHKFVFPQPPYDINPADVSHQITSLPNPGIFSANEVKVGCCTIDILKQLSGEEISRHPRDGSSGDRLSRLASHLINQHSFYPLYPPAEGVPLDFSIAPGALDIPTIPHIMILPSDLAPFVKVLSVKGTVSEGDTSNCLCVNPGRLAKGIGGGTFVDLIYRESPKNAQASIIRI